MTVYVIYCQILCKREDTHTKRIQAAFSNTVYTNVKTRTQNTYRQLYDYYERYI